MPQHFARVMGPKVLYLPIAEGDTLLTVLRTAVKLIAQQDDTSNHGFSRKSTPLVAVDLSSGVQPSDTLYLMQRTDGGWHGYEYPTLDTTLAGPVPQLPQSLVDYINDLKPSVELASYCFFS